MTQVIVPELGEHIEKATVSYWYFQEGDTVAEKEDLVELVTDKATFNLPAPASGKLIEIKFRDGDEVAVGEVIAVIEE